MKSKVLQSKPVVEIIDLLTSKDYVDDLSCYRTDGTHCRIYGPARVTKTTYSDGGIHQLISDLPKKCHICHSTPWKCRECGRQTCEHFCRFKKEDGSATCGSCIK